MKNTILFISIFLFSNSMIFGQTYYPMPIDSASWTYIYYGYGTTPPETTTAHFGFQGDTLIDGVKYSKLYENPGDLGFPNPEVCFNAEAAPYVTYMREDADKKVWLKVHPDSTEQLIYDFGLDVGDTFCFPTPQPATGTFCFDVSMVDSILVNGNYRRQIHFEDTNGEEQWIEGIGSMTEMYFASWTLIGNVDSELGCYYENEKLIFGDSTFCNCFDTDNVNDFSSFDPKLKIFPNPFANFFTLEFELEKKENIYVQIINLLGQRVFSSKFELSQGEHQLKIEDIEDSGIYFIHLETEEWKVSKKIIRE